MLPQKAIVIAQLQHFASAISNVRVLIAQHCFMQSSSKPVKQPPDESQKNSKTLHEGVNIIVSKSELVIGSLLSPPNNQRMSNPTRRGAWQRRNFRKGEESWKYHNMRRA